jgi:RNA polymerase sigma factor (sigma-70 family)
VRDHARRLATEERNSVLPEGPAPEQPDVACERAEVVSIVRSALERLSPRDREALLLRESGFRYAEIAEVIGVRTEIVPTLIARAMRRLQKSYLMEGRDVASA